MKLHLLVGILLFLSLQACSSKSEKQNENHFSNSYTHYQVRSPDYSDIGSDEEPSDEEAEENLEYYSGSRCRFEDGTYSATVDYYNPDTGYSQTYILDVEVEDCQVVQINFPNGGWLDNDHISSAELDEDGSCFVDGEDGKTYYIQLDD